MSNNTIQAARPEDVPQIVALGYSSFYENNLGDFKVAPDFDKTLINITNFVMDDIVFVKRNEEDQAFIDGCLVLNTSETWWSEQPILYTVLFFIKPEKRSFKIARNLLKNAQDYAIMNRLPLIVDLFAQRDIDKKRKLLKFVGFKECGSLFIFNGT